MAVAEVAERRNKSGEERHFIRVIFPIVSTTKGLGWVFKVQRAHSAEREDSKSHRHTDYYL